MVDDITVAQSLVVCETFQTQEPSPPFSARCLST